MPPRAGWLQSAFFDTITTDEHGPELRQQARLLNQQIERFLQDPCFQDANAGTLVTDLDLTGDENENHGSTTTRPPTTTTRASRPR